MFASKLRHTLHQHCAFSSWGKLFQTWETRKLGRLGLIGKIRLSSTMSAVDVEAEIRSVFSKAMQSRNDFPFEFLQPTGCCNRSLTLPAISLSFSWIPQTVARLGTSKQPLYILCKEKLALEDIEVIYYYRHYNRVLIS